MEGPGDGPAGQGAACRKALGIRGVGVYVVDAGKTVDSSIYFDLGAFGVTGPS